MRAFPRRFVPLAAGLAATALCACGPQAPKRPEPPLVQLLPGPHQTMELTVEDLGTIRIELLPEAAPQTVAAFKQLAAEGYYDGTSFHRVIPGFVIQGGDPLTRNQDPRDDGKGGSGTIIPDEFTSLSHLRGRVAMANRGRLHSADGQFFIVHQDSPQLDGGYTIFGRVSEGMEVVDAITRLEIDKYGRYGPPDRPYPRDARIVSVRIDPTTATAATAAR